jgi:hypothetical protein
MNSRLATEVVVTGGRQIEPPCEPGVVAELRANNLQMSRNSDGITHHSSRERCATCIASLQGIGFPVSKLAARLIANSAIVGPGASISCTVRIFCISSVSCMRCSESSV